MHPRHTLLFDATVNPNDEALTKTEMTISSCHVHGSYCATSKEPISSLQLGRETLNFGDVVFIPVQILLALGHQMNPCALLAHPASSAVLGRSRATGPQVVYVYTYQDQLDLNFHQPFKLPDRIVKMATHSMTAASSLARRGGA